LIDSFAKYDTMVDMVLQEISEKFQGSHVVFRTSTPGFYGCENHKGDPLMKPQALTPEIDTYEWRKP
jgi:hypothetical protein